jgi:hypothetical protein
MSMIGKMLSMFGGGSSKASPTALVASAPATATTTAPVKTARLLSKKRKSSETAPVQAAQQHEDDSENNSSLANRASINTVPMKEDSPPKKQKLNSGVAAPIVAVVAPTAPAIPLQPMPAAVRNLLAVLQVELDSRIDGLQNTSKFQLESFDRSFKNEVNKIPAKVRALTLGQFLASAYEGDSTAVMAAGAMASQGKLESWVAATPKLRSSRKHRSILLANPNHSALLATAQRMTRASARKMNPGMMTGLSAVDEEPQSANSQAILASQNALQVIAAAEQRAEARVAAAAASSSAAVASSSDSNKTVPSTPRTSESRAAAAAENRAAIASSNADAKAAAAEQKAREKKEKADAKEREKKEKAEQKEREKAEKAAAKAAAEAAANAMVDVAPATDKAAPARVTRARAAKAK